MKNVVQRGLLCALLFSVLAYFVFALTSVNVISPTTNQNVSGVILLNATTDQEAVNVTFYWYDASDGSLDFNITIYNDTSSDTVFENASFNTALLSDGIYNLTINATNSTGSVVSNTSVTGITVDNTAPVVTLINSSFNTTDTTPSVTFNFTDTVFATASCVLYLNGTAYNTSTVNNATNTELTVNTTLSDGSYSANVNCTDSSSNEGNSSSITVIVDTRVPVTTFNSPTSGSYHLVDFVLNVTVTDALTVQYRIENGSNSSQVVVNYTNMSNPSGNFWNATINISTISDWNYTLRINATDALGNANTTETLVFGVDTTNPTISSVSCNNINVGGSQSCSCTAADNSQSFGGSVSTSISSASTSTSGTKTVTCTATDSAGNTATSDASYTVSSTGGGSGAGGSAGGVSTGVSGQFEKKVWASINQGELAKVELKNGAIGFTEIEFNMKEKVYGAWVSVTKKDTLPSLVKPFQNKVYRYVEVSLGPSLKKDVFDNSKINFKVEKSWLTENSLSNDKVVLFRYDNEQWNKLLTTVGTDDGTYVHYVAETPGFSYFLIGQGEVEAAKPVETEAVQPAVEVSAIEEKIPVVEAGTEEVKVEPKKSIASWLVPIVILLILVAAGVIFYLSNKRKKELLARRKNLRNKMKK
ncbi:MAG: PGF-pre-PGF domain-containing protein [Nanoarchaeota archaeon]|nr:PGF-pre-PGF domain-containing protein [Nanoarchaeota archaeon]MBU1977125.1 PGF-pre-PGF domain-containing protein [Nanoarchaeota archaeon]